MGSQPGAARRLVAEHQVCSAPSPPPRGSACSLTRAGSHPHKREAEGGQRSSTLLLGAPQWASFLFSRRLCPTPLCFCGKAGLSQPRIYPRPGRVKEGSFLSPSRCWLLSWCVPDPLGPGRIERDESDTVFYAQAAEGYQMQSEFLNHLTKAGFANASTGRNSRSCHCLGP